jgi:hypothetical protein
MKRLALVQPLLAAAAAVLVCASAQATPVTWSLSGAKFTDGTSLAGSFVYDVDVNAFSAWSFATEAGVLAARTYTVLNSVSFLTSDHHFAVNRTDGSAYLTVELASMMTNAGGTIDIIPNFSLSQPAITGSYECTNCLQFRFLSAGSITTLPASTRVPEPGSLALVFAALGGLAVAQRRRA